MSYITKGLRQKAVYWGSPTENGFGELTFADPVEIDCRWEEKNKLFIDVEGKQVVSRAVVFVGQDLELKGYLYEGELSEIASDEEGDPTKLDGAYEIRAFGKIPNTRGTLFERTAWLSTYDF